MATSLLDFWKDLNLPRLQQGLDTTATEVAARQDDSDVSRKRLIENSREYKRQTPEDERRRVAPLLKSFQGEVDSLSRRAKASETAFLNIYKRLADAPDPVPALEQSSELQKHLLALKDVQIENQKLRETLSQYNKEFAEVKTQEVTVNRLREKLKEYEERMQDTAQAHAREKEKELQLQFAEKERELTNQQVELATKLGLAEQKITSLEAALSASRNEVFEMRAKTEEEISARLSELEMVTTDLDRCQQRAVMAEKEVERLKEQLAAAQQAIENGSLARSNAEKQFAADDVSQASLEAEVAAKDREVVRLVGDVQQLQAALVKMRENSAGQLQSLEQQLATKTTACQKLEERISEQEDYAEVKRELSVLKMIEFSSSNRHEGDEDDSSTDKPLELLFIEKNKALQAENTTLKVSQTELNARLMELEEHEVDCKATIDKQKSLIAQLEQDLINLQALVSSRPAGEASPEILSEATQQQPTGPSTPVAPPTDSLLPIVSSQRERFRQRNLELEAENRQLHQTIAVLRNEIDTLRSDNVKLYEKIKFLQSYPTSTQKPVEDSTVTRYSSQYEDRLDPFAAFNKRERQRKYMGLSAPERATLNMAQFVLSNKTARTVFFFYMVLLHLLTFFVLYKFAYVQDCHRDMAADCFASFEAHMRRHHQIGVDGSVAPPHLPGLERLVERHSHSRK